LAEPQQSKAFGWLAFSSALLVLLASGVAISRLGDDDGDSRVASAPTTGPAIVDGAGGTDSGEAAGGDGAAAASGPAGAAASDANAATESAAPAVTAPAGRTARGTSSGARGDSAVNRAAQGSSGTGGSSAGVDPGSGGPSTGTPPSGEDQAGHAQGGNGGTDGTGNGGQTPGTGGDGSPDGGHESPPAPSQEPPEQDTRLVAASASAGEGAQGGVISVAADGTDLDVDLTLGRDQLVGNHPPSDGTGVSFGGRLLNPPSVSPAFPTLSG
jgi:hypothetical protein